LAASQRPCHPAAYGGLSAAAACGITELAEIPAEFWHHAALTTGVWFTLSALLPDYARRAVNHRGYLKAGLTHSFKGPGINPCT
jgi:hypothetical protein